jgi:hypothetical protein
MTANWSMFCTSIEYKTRDDTQFSEMVSDTRERPAAKDKTKELVNHALLCCDFNTPKKHQIISLEIIWCFCYLQIKGLQFDSRSLASLSLGVQYWY